MAKTPKKASAKNPDKAALLNTVADAMFQVAENKGWSRLTVRDVAREAGLPLADVLGPYPSKYCILNAYQDALDAKVLANVGDAADDDTDGVRDRLFDLLMERFDGLAPYRSVFQGIAREVLADPMALPAYAPRMARTMARFLDAAGLDVSGPRGMLRMKGLALVYADAFRVWLNDDSEDLAKTMSALDRALARAEKAARFLKL